MTDNLLIVAGELKTYDETKFGNEGSPAVIIAGCGCCGSPYGDNFEYDVPLMLAAPQMLAILKLLLANGIMDKSLIEKIVTEAETKFKPSNVIEEN